MTQIQWQLKPSPSPDLVKALSDAININEILAVLLVQRGVTSFDEAKAYFRPGLEDLHDPFLMKGMEVAVERLSQAIAEGERILVYGDYDVDGTCSVALFFGFLKGFYGNVDFYIPDRYKEGYGISEAGVEYAAQSGVNLIVSIDCGIKAVNQITSAKEKGIDFIVCDHHLPGEELPPAVAILDPKQSDCPYPYKELCGCGVAFKLICAFAEHNTLPEEKVYERLDLVAIATASDIVPITGENRTLVKHGLAKLNTNPLPGVASLIEVAGFESDLNVTNVVFAIGPRINAAGRITHARGAAEVLLSESLEEARTIAKEINQHNTSRRTLDKGITQEALQLIDVLGIQENFSTVLYSENWHKGVIGIVASRCIESYYRPTIILTGSNGKAAGSARSVPGFDVHAAIEACAEHLEQFGGHKYAAGLTIKKENIPAFQEAFEKVVAERITPEQRIPVQEIDMEVPFSAFTEKFFRILKQMEPFGPANMTPVFMTRGVINAGTSRIVKEDHLKLDVADENGHTMSGIAFGQAKWFEALNRGEKLDVCYTVEENTFRGVTTLQLMVKDIRSH